MFCGGNRLEMSSVGFRCLGPVWSFARLPKSRDLDTLKTRLLLSMYRVLDGSSRSGTSHFRATFPPLLIFVTISNKLFYSKIVTSFFFVTKIATTHKRKSAPTQTVSGFVGSTAATPSWCNADTIKNTLVDLPVKRCYNLVSF
jgi:hypothetical protein